LALLGSANSRQAPRSSGTLWLFIWWNSCFL